MLLQLMQEYPGQLFLGVFSGPVEGILMIITIFLISGTYGNRPKRKVLIPVLTSE